MYSRKAWGGAVDPFILVTFPNETIEADSEPVIGLIIYEWQDEPLIGRPVGSKSPEVQPDTPDANRVGRIHC